MVNNHEGEIGRTIFNFLVAACLGLSVGTCVNQNNVEERLKILEDKVLIGEKHNSLMTEE